jgi:hypothetical protein
MKLLDVAQGSPDWFAARLGIPTASHASEILTRGGKASASQAAYMGLLIDECVHPDAEPAFTGNRHTERGNALEPQARDWYRLVTRQDVRQVGFVLSDDGLAGCSPDSLIYVDGTPRKGLEIKAPEGKKHAAWMIAGVVPDEHMAQVHMSMVVTQLQEWDFMSYCPGYKPFKVAVDWDEYTDKMAAELKAFTVRLAAAKAKFIDYIPERRAA